MCVRKNDLIAAPVFLQGVLVVPAALQVLLRSVARDAVWRGDCCGRFHVLDWKRFGREVRGKTHSATFTLKTRRPWVCGKLEIEFSKMFVLQTLPVILSVRQSDFLFSYWGFAGNWQTFMGYLNEKMSDFHSHKLTPYQHSILSEAHDHITLIIFTIITQAQVWYCFYATDLSRSDMWKSTQLCHSSRRWLLSSALQSKATNTTKHNFNGLHFQNVIMIPYWLP